MSRERERGTISIILREKDDIEMFERVKKLIGIKSNIDVLRFLMNYYLKQQEGMNDDPQSGTSSKIK